MCICIYIYILCVHAYVYIYIYNTYSYTVIYIPKFIDPWAVEIITELSPETQLLGVSDPVRPTTRIRLSPPECHPSPVSRKWGTPKWMCYLMDNPSLNG